MIIVKKVGLKFNFIIVAMLFWSMISTAQTKADIFAISELNITYIGVDFSHAKYFGPTADSSEAVIKNMLNSINEIKYLVGESFRKENMKFDISFTNEINSTIDPETFFAPDLKSNLAFNKDTIKSIIANYKFNAADTATALVIVIEAMNKFEENASMWFTFFKRETKEVILTKQIIGKARGIGFRNHWAGAIKNAVGQVEADKFQVWKKAYVPKDYYAATDTITYQVSFIGGVELNFCGGNNEHTKGYANNGMIFTSGILYRHLFSISVNYGIQMMEVNPKYGPEYNGTHEYYISQLFLKTRISPLKGWISPVLFGGYGIGTGFFSSSISSGTMLNAGVGIDFKLSPKFKVDLSYIYQYQELYYDSYHDDHADIKGKGMLYLSYAGINLSLLVKLGISK